MLNNDNQNKIINEIIINHDDKLNPVNYATRETSTRAHSL